MGNVSKFINTAFITREIYLDVSASLNDILEKVSVICR